MNTLKEHLLRGQHLVLHSDGALFWREEKLLIVADLHLGKAQTLREHGIPVPGGTTPRDLDRMSSLLTQFQPSRLLFLGDLTHDKLHHSADFNRIIDQWRKRHLNIKMILVAGNHDRRAGIPPVSFRLECVARMIEIEPFCFTHKPRAIVDSYNIAGHIHPAVILTGKARQKESLPCFHFGQHNAIMPAFGSFTGNQLIHPLPGDKIFVIAEHEIVEVDND